MQPSKIKIPFGGKMVDGTDLSIVESKEAWGQYTLEDGSVIRVKVSVMGVVRMDGQYDNQGNPTYALKAVLLSTPVSIPENLRKKAN
jgi:hypothetical protein